MSLPNVDLTSTWIPLGFLGVLLLYMVRLFLQERRESMALAAAEAMSAPTPPTLEDATVEATQPAAEPSVAPIATIPPVETAVAAAPRRKSSLVWRAAWIWLPFVAGFAGQAYLDVVKPLLEKTAS